LTEGDEVKTKTKTEPAWFTISYDSWYQFNLGKLSHLLLVDGMTKIATNTATSLSMPALRVRRFESQNVCRG
jgi:hypothetical protein